MVPPARGTRPAPEVAPPGPTKIPCGAKGPRLGAPRLPGSAPAGEEPRQDAAQRAGAAAAAEEELPGTRGERRGRGRCHQVDASPGLFLPPAPGRRVLPDSLSPRPQGDAAGLTRGGDSGRQPSGGTDCAMSLPAWGTGSPSCPMGAGSHPQPDRTGAFSSPSPLPPPTDVCKTRQRKAKGAPGRARGTPRGAAVAVPPGVTPTLSRDSYRRTLPSCAFAAPA